MSNTVYCLEKYHFFYYDKEDDENVESRYLLGYFNCQSSLENALKVCKLNGIQDDELKIEQFNLSLSKKQKYLYILTYSYSTRNEKGEYTDYEYIFEPKTNRKKCLELKEELCKQSKYSHTKKKIYDSETANGYYISRYEINKLYSVVQQH